MRKACGPSRRQKSSSPTESTFLKRERQETYLNQLKALSSQLMDKANRVPLFLGRWASLLGGPGWPSVAPTPTPRCLLLHCGPSWVPMSQSSQNIRNSAKNTRTNKKRTPYFQENIFLRVLGSQKSGQNRDKLPLHEDKHAQARPEGMARGFPSSFGPSVFRKLNLG